jgi:hypothetical protein
VTVRRISSGTLVDTPLVTTAETVVATVTGVSTGQAGQFVDLTGDFNITLGTNTTAVTVRVRRDSLTGTLVGEATPEAISTAAGSAERHHVFFQDANAGEFLGRTYVLTVQQTGASANGNVTDAGLACEIYP